MDYNGFLLVGKKVKLLSIQLVNFIISRSNSLDTEQNKTEDKVIYLRLCRY